MNLDQIANFGFAAVVAAFVLIRMEGVLRELRDAVRDQTQSIVATGNETKLAISENTSTISRLATAIDHIYIGRSEARRAKEDS